MRPHPPAPLLAALLTVIASAFVAGTTLLAKSLGSDLLGPALSPLQVSFGRFLFGLAAVSCAAAVLRPRLYRPALRLHVMRSGFGWGGVTLMFAAATFIPLADATAISFVSPVFAMVFAIPLLGERVGIRRWGPAIIALAGAAILLRPGNGALQVGALLALGAALFMGAELVLIKQLTGRERPHQILLINNAIGTVIAGIAASSVWIAPTPAQWAALAGIGGLMALAQTAFVNAMARADASFTAPFFYTTLVFATLYDGAVFATWPDQVSLLGAGVIVTGAALLAWREARRKRSPDTPVPAEGDL